MAQTFTTPPLNISNTAAYSGNPSIATDSSSIYVVWNEKFSGNNEITFSKSTDGGLSFSTPLNISNTAGDPINNDAENSIYPSIATDSSSIYVSWTEIEDPLGLSEIFFSKSTDGGLSFSTPLNISNTAEFSDSSSIALYGSNIYAFWVEQHPGNREIFFSKSTDGGLSFSTPLNISNTAETSDYPSIALDGSNIYTIWHEDGKITFSKSTDGGLSFSTPLDIAPSISESSIALDGSNIYVSWTNSNPSPAEIFFSKSTDGGLSFSTPLNISNDPEYSGYPSITTDGSNIYVSWSSFYNNNDTADILFSKSTDGGLSFSTSFNISNTAEISGNPSITTDGSKIYVSWFERYPWDAEIFVISSKIPSSTAQLNWGDILVVDPTLNPVGQNRGALFHIDPANGQRTIISDFTDPAQGDLGKQPIDVAVDNLGDIWVIDDLAGMYNRGALFHIDPANGQRTIISDFGDPTQGELGISPREIKINSLGQIFVGDSNLRPSSPGTPNGGIFEVNPLTGYRTLLSDGQDTTQGLLKKSLTGLAITYNGTIFAVSPNNPSFGGGFLYTVDPYSGFRTPISDFSDPNQGQVDEILMHADVNLDGRILVIDQGAGTNGSGLLFSVDPITGYRTILSDFGNAAQGDLGSQPHVVHVSPSGKILVTDFFAGTDLAGILFEIDPITGYRTILSDFGNAAQGDLGSNPAGVTTVVPEFGTISALILAAALISIIAVTAKSKLNIIPRY